MFCSPSSSPPGAGLLLRLPPGFPAALSQRRGRRRRGLRHRPLQDARRARHPAVALQLGLGPPPRFLCVSG